MSQRPGTTRGDDGESDDVSEKTGSVLGRLVLKAYPAPEWAVFFEVGDSTGSHATRHADAIALGIWPSRGYQVIGFEFKASRRDWLREKKNPQKAEAMAAHCDLWFVVAADASVVKTEELPAPWGLYVANASRSTLKMTKAAVPFPDRNQAVLPRAFIAAMLRKVSETSVPRVDLERLIADAAKKAVASSAEGYELKLLRDKVAYQRRVLDGFKARTGVDLEVGWSGPEKIAAAVAAVLEGQRYRNGLDQTRKELERAARDIGKALEQWPRTSADE